MGKRGPRPTGRKKYVGLFAFDYPSQVEAKPIHELVIATPSQRTSLAGMWYSAWARENNYDFCFNCQAYIEPQDFCPDCGAGLGKLRKRGQNSIEAAKEQNPQ